MRGLDHFKVFQKKPFSILFYQHILHNLHAVYCLSEFLPLQAFIRCWKYFKTFRAFDGRSRFQLFLTSAQFELALSQS